MDQQLHELTVSVYHPILVSRNSALEVPFHPGCFGLERLISNAHFLSKYLLRSLTNGRRYSGYMIVLAHQTDFDYWNGSVSKYQIWAEEKIHRV